MKLLTKIIFLSSVLMLSGSLSAQPYIISNTGEQVLPVFGNNDFGTTYEFRCPASHTLGLIDVEYGWHHLGNAVDYVNGVRMGCSEFLEDGRMGAGIVWQSQLGYPVWFGNANGANSMLDCYPDQWTGIHGRTGQWVDQLGGYCGDINAVLAGQHSTTLSALGGTGGSPNESKCPAGYIPTGAKVTVLNGGNYIQGIELICGRVYEAPGSLTGESDQLD